MIRAAPERDSFFASEIDPVLRRHLEHCLLVPKGKAGWYAAGPLTPSNAAKFANKARCVIQEKYISARLDEAAALFSDIRLTSSSRIIRHRVDEYRERWTT